METPILFWTMIFGACGYAVLLGGWEGKCTAAVFVIASAASYASNAWLHISWNGTDIGLFAVDFVTLVALYLVAAGSRRWWPLWVAAFQLNSLAAHVATLISPHFAIKVYQGYEGLWAIPCVLVMVFGIFRDRLWKFRHEFA